MHTLKQLLVAVVALTAFVTFSSTASAANFCVGASPACTNSPVAEYPQTSSGITNAINDASGAASDNVVFLAAGSYSISPATFPTLPSSPTGVSIVGAGVGQTILNGTTGSGPLIDLQLQKTADTFSGITLNANITNTFALGVTIGRGKLTNFELNQTGTLPMGTPAAALEMGNGTTATDGVINSSTNATGLSLFNGSTTVRRVTLTGSGTGTGVMVGGTADTDLANLRVTGYSSGLRVMRGTVEFNDSLIDMKTADNSFVGLVVEDQNSASAASIQINAARDTIVGTGGSLGMYLQTQEAIDSISGSFRDMLIYNSDASTTSWVCNEFSGSSIAFDFSGLASNSATQFNAGCGANQEAPVPLTLLTSPFVDLPGSDFRPKWDSSLVDTGGSTSQSGGNDLTGDPRVVDGDNNGTATVDIGAFEYQAAPPTGSISAPATASVGQSVTFSSSMTDPDPTNSIATFAWSFGDGGTSTLASPTHAYSTAGTYDVTLSATNLAGSVGTATARIVIPVVPVNKPEAAPPTAKVTAKPKKAFKIGKKGFYLAPKAATSFTVAFNGATQAKFTLKSIGKNKKLKSLKGSQALSWQTTAPANKFAFGGTWNKKKLAAGRYRLSITPLGADGTAGKPVTLDLKLKK